MHMINNSDIKALVKRKVMKLIESQIMCEYVLSVIVWLHDLLFAELHLTVKYLDFLFCKIFL